MAEMNQEEQEQFDEELLLETLHNENMMGFREEFLHLHPYDQAKFFIKIDDDIRLKVYLYLSPKEVSDFF